MEKENKNKKTTITLSLETVKRLHEIKKYGESYDDVINKLIELLNKK